MRRRGFLQVDVFGHRPLLGNPLAVVLDADGLNDDQMQGFARWTNLSETAFILPPTNPGADYRVRIFTLSRELPFAGHPTLGACHAWLASGGVPKGQGSVVQQCGVGLIRIRRDRAGRLAFMAPPLVRSGPVAPNFVDDIITMLDVDRSAIVETRWVDNGPGWVGVLLGDARQVINLEPDGGAVRRILREHESLKFGVIAPHASGTDYAFEVRAFYTDDRGDLREDPVTGSLNAALAAWMFETDRSGSPYTARQGTRIGRDGRPVADFSMDGSVWLSGSTMTVMAGVVYV